VTAGAAWDSGRRRQQSEERVEWFIAVGVVVLMTVLLVGLFHGPSHEHGRHRPARAGGTTVPAPEPPSTVTPSVAPAAPAPPIPAVAPVEPPPDLPAYTLPPPRPRRHLHRRSDRRPGGRRS
jgi:hypothetical protein